MLFFSPLQALHSGFLSGWLVSKIDLKSSEMAWNEHMNMIHRYQKKRSNCYLHRMGRQTNLETHEDFSGFYNIPDIGAETSSACSC